MTPRISLVGYRACGKSTVGPLVAQHLGLRFVDADQLLESRLGLSISEFFTANGENAFRDRETELLAELLADDTPLVLATGGGAILREANRIRLRERGGVVAYLQAPAAVLQARLRANVGGRPSLSGKSVWDEVPGLLAIREPLYREVATLVLDATRPPLEHLATLTGALGAVEKSRSKADKNSSKPSPPPA